MKDYEETEHGVKKYHGWGWSEIRAPFEDCFTFRELLQVFADHKLMKDAGLTDPRLTDRLNRIREKLTQTLGLHERDSI